MQTFAEEGMTFGGTSGVYVQNKGRIFFLQRGETRLPNPVPQSYAGFPASLGWNVLKAAVEFGKTLYMLLTVR